VYKELVSGHHVQHTHGIPNKKQSADTTIT